MTTKLPSSNSMVLAQKQTQISMNRINSLEMNLPGQLIYSKGNDKQWAKVVFSTKGS